LNPCLRACRLLPGSGSCAATIPGRGCTGRWDASSCFPTRSVSWRTVLWRRRGPRPGMVVVCGRPLWILRPRPRPLATRRSRAADCAYASPREAADRHSLLLGPVWPTSVPRCRAPRRRLPGTPPSGVGMGRRRAPSGRWPPARVARRRRGRRWRGKRTGRAAAPRTGI